MFSTRIFSMYESGFRQAVVMAYAHFRSFRITAKVFDCSIGSVHAWLKNAGKKRKHRVSKLERVVTPIVKRAVAECFKQNPFHTRSSIRSVLCDMNIDLSEKLVGCMLKSMGYTRKRRRSRVEKRGCKDAAALFRRTFPRDTPSNRLYALDEMGVSEKTLPLYGYAQKGQRVYTVSSTGSWTNYSTIACVSATGSVCYGVQKRSFKKDTFSAFVRSLAVPPGSFVILDNLRVHKSEEAMSAFADKQVTPLFIPPYQPDFNPIENVFSFVKHDIRKRRANGLAVADAIHASMSNIDPQKVKRCFEHMIRLVDRGA